MSGHHADTAPSPPDEVVSDDAPTSTTMPDESDGDATSEIPVESDESAAGDGEVTARERSWFWNAVIGAVFVVVAVSFWSGFHIEGHNSGDDFALYVDQARALIQGDIADTLTDTRYTVDNSAWHTFSPYSYSWGLPVLLAPVMLLSGAVDPVAGIDYGPLKLMITLTFAVGLLAYHHVCRRRVHPAGAVLLPMFFATSYWYVLHTDQVLSELPFLMWLMLFVVWLDRLVERKALLTAPRWQLVTLAAFALMAFNTRREGLGVLIGLLAAQAAALWAETHAHGLRARLARLRELDWKPIATPWVTFVATTAVVQLTLPSDFLPRFTERDPAADSGLHRIPGNIRIYRLKLGELLGFKDPGPYEVTVFDSTTLGTAAMYLILAFAAIGVVVMLLRHTARDAGLVGVGLGVAIAVLSAPFQDFRYLMALIPFLLLFAYVGVSLPLRMLLRVPDTWPMFVAEVAVTAMILGGLPDIQNAYEYRSNWVGVQAGPQEPDTLDMWQAVRRETRGDAVIVFARARMMGLYTGRTSVQGGSIDFIERAGDFYVMYLNPDGSPGTYSQYPLEPGEADDRGFTEVWRNNGWVIFRTPTSQANDPSLEGS